MAGAATRFSSYEEACAQHRWDVPEHYNIAAGRLRQAPAGQARDDPRALRRRRCARSAGASCRRRRNRFANVLRAHGVEKGDRVAMLLPPTPETAAAFFGTWKCGAILLSMSVLYGDDGIRHRVKDSEAKVLVTDSRQRRARRPRGWSSTSCCSTTRTCWPACDDTFEARGHARRRPGAALLLLRHHRARQGDPPRAPLPARARGVRLLPRRAGGRALPRDGGVGVGGGHRAAARPVAARRGPARLPARGRLRPAQAARRALAPRRHQRLHDADRDALDDGHRRRGHPLSAALPRGLQRGRAAQPGGDPLVPLPVRPHRARLLRADGVLSARRQLPVHGGARGLDGQADAGLGRRHPRRGRAARGRPASAARSACARARTRTIRWATGATRRPRRRRSAATGSTRRTPPRPTRTATSGTRAAPTT